MMQSTVQLPKDLPKIKEFPKIHPINCKNPSIVREKKKKDNYKLKDKDKNRCKDKNRN